MVKHARKAVAVVKESLSLGKVVSGALVLLSLLGEHKMQDWKDAAHDARTVTEQRRDSLAFVKAVARVNARVDSMGRVVRALQRRAHMTPAEIARYQVGPPEPPPKRGGLTGFLSRFFGSGG